MNSIHSLFLDIRVTLWDIFTLGLDNAVREKADPEVRAYMDQMMQLQQQQQQPQA